MAQILKGEVVKFLAADSGVSALVGGNIYARRIDLTRGIPAIVVSKTSESSAATHSGADGVMQSTFSFYVFARTDKELEQIKQAINGILDANRIETSEIIADFYLTNDADFDDYETLELDEWAGVLEFDCNWHRIEGD